MYLLETESYLKQSKKEWNFKELKENYHEFKSKRKDNKLFLTEFQESLNQSSFALHTEVENNILSVFGNGKRVMIRCGNAHYGENENDLFVYYDSQKQHVDLFPDMMIEMIDALTL